MAELTKEENLVAHSDRLTEVDLENLMNLYGSSVLKFAFAYLKDKSIAEDVFQEVFIRVFQSWGTIRDPNKVKTWILKITANLCRDQFRMRSRQNLLTTSEDFLVQIPGTQDTSQEVIQREQDRLLMKAVLALDIMLRETVMLYFYEELNTKEIASILNISPITVRVRLYRARKILKRWLEKEGIL